MPHIFGVEHIEPFDHIFWSPASSYGSERVSISCKMQGSELLNLPLVILYTVDCGGWEGRTAGTEVTTVLRCRNEGQGCGKWFCRVTRRVIWIFPST